MKLLTWCFVILIVPAFLAGQEIFTVEETQHQAQYEAEWDLSSLPWHQRFFGTLFGAFPSRFQFQEIRWRMGINEEFFMEFSDEDGDLWARFHSDTLYQESAVWLPDEPKQALGGDVVRFIRAMKIMFGDSLHTSFEGMFAFGASSLTARAMSPAYLRESEFPIFLVETRDSSGCVPLWGAVGITSNPHPHYQFFTVYLAKSGIRLTLREVKKP